MWRDHPCSESREDESRVFDTIFRNSFLREEIAVGFQKPGGDCQNSGTPSKEMSSGRRGDGIHIQIGAKLERVANWSSP